MIIARVLRVAMLGSGWVMDLLALLSVVSVGAIVERWLFFRTRGRSDDRLGDELVTLLEGGHDGKAVEVLRSQRTVEAEVLLAAMRWTSGGAKALASAVEGEMTRRRKDLERGMTLLGTLGNNAPFIGLLGTVIGVIVAFADLAQGSNKVQMDKVMGGIAEALIATGVGLFVAIPAVVAYNVFQKKISDVEDGVLSVSLRVCAVLEAKATGGASAGPASTNVTAPL